MVLIVAGHLGLARASPDLADAAVQRGKALQADGLYEQAATALTEATVADPNHAEAFSELGRTRLAQSRFESAIGALEKALALNPDLADARYNLAYCYRKVGAPERAAEEYGQYLARVPNDADAQFGLAASLKEAGQAHAAAAAFERYAALEKRPAWGRWIEQARAEARRLRSSATPAPENAPDPRPAIGALPPEAPQVPTGPPRAASPAKTAHRPRSEAFFAGLSLLRAGDYAAAKEALLRTADRRPEDPFVLSALAGAHLGLREGEEAEALYYRALRTAPPGAWGALYFGLGEAVRLQGRREEAVGFYEEAAVLSDHQADIQRAAQARLSTLRR